MIFECICFLAGEYVKADYCELFENMGNFR